MLLESYQPIEISFKLCNCTLSPVVAFVTFAFVLLSDTLGSCLHISKPVIDFPFDNSYLLLPKAKDQNWAESCLYESYPFLSHKSYEIDCLDLGIPFILSVKISKNLKLPH